MNQISLKDTFLNILNNSIIIGFWTGVFWCASNLFLSVIGLQYRAWVTNSLIAISFFLMFIWVIYKIITQKDRWKRMKMLLALFGLLIVLWLARFPLLVIGTAVLRKERVDTIDGQTFVGYETDFIDKWIDYYEYKNVFVAGSKEIFTLAGVNETDDGKTIYYDMNGTQIEHLTDLYEFNQ